MTTSKNRNTVMWIAITIILIIIVMGAIGIYNHTKSPKSCTRPEGLVYNDEDFGAILKLGGQRCEVCKPIGGSYVNSQGKCMKCGDNQYWNGTTCAYCPIGEVLDKSTYRCKCDGDNIHRNLAGDCIDCGENNGWDKDADTCVPCIDKQSVIDGLCKCIGGSRLVETMAEDTDNPGVMIGTGTYTCECPLATPSWDPTKHACVKTST